MCVSGYQCEYKKRTGSKPDGCAIVFKSSRLSLLSSNPVEFLRPGDALLDRDNVGLVLLLQPNGVASSLSRSSSICVANTHLLYNPRRGDVKLAQLAILLAEISRMSRLPNGAISPVVLCGDLNSTPLSPLYRFLTTGCLNYGGLKMGSVRLLQPWQQSNTPIDQLIGQFSCLQVSGQENSPRGHRLLPCPIWSPSLGIDHRCQYRDKEVAAAAASTSSSTGSPSEPPPGDFTDRIPSVRQSEPAALCLKTHLSFIDFCLKAKKPPMTPAQKIQKPATTLKGQIGFVSVNLT